MSGLIGVALAPVPTAATAGINGTLNFQGRLLSATGAVVPDGNYNMEFRIYQDGTGTAQYNGGSYATPTGLDWSEDWLDSNTQGVVVKNGYFSVNLGTLCPFPTSGTLSCQGATNSPPSWNDNTLWLSMNVAGSGEATANCGATQALFHQTWNGTNGCSADGEMLPMRAMTSSVYAQNANELFGLTSGQYVQLAQPIQSASTSTNPAIGINVTSGAGNIVTLQSSGADVFDVTSAGNALFGNGAAHTVSIAQSAASIVGQALTISSGQGGTGTGSAGGLLTLQGGAGGGTTGNGGGVTIDAGAVTGSGTAGTVSVGTANAGTINLGNANAGTTTTLKSGSGGLTVSATGGSLTVQTVTSGALALTSAGALNLTGAANSTWSVGAGNTLAVTSSDFNVSASGVLNVVGGSAGFQIGGAAASGNYLRGNASNEFVSSTIQPGDIPVCTGTCHYISNQTTSQTTANFNIQSAASSDIGGIIQGASSQTADLFDLEDSTGAAIDRFDASGDLEKLGFVDNGYGGIGAYSNLLTYSETFTNAAWVASNVTVTGASTAAPDGQTTGATLADTASGGSVAQTSATAAGSTYTFSVWLKTTSGTQAFALRVDGATTGTGTVMTGTATTTWQRFSVTQNTTGFTGNVKTDIFPGGTGASGTVYAWGGDLTAGSNPGAYVRTTASTVAASSGVVSNGGVFISAINASDVPLVIQAAPTPTGNLLAIQGSGAAALFTINSTGTITVGAWQGTAVAAPYGGTGQTTYAVGDLLYASTTSALSKLADVATGSCLASGGVGVAPTWSTCGTGAYLVQVPTTNSGAGSNDIQPTLASINGLTVNGTSNATGATALIVAQSIGGAGIDAEDINVTNGSGTVGAGLSIAKSGAGTLTDGLLFSGTIGTTITTAGAASPAAITIQPGTATGGAGSAASITGGTASSGAGGTATLQGGAAAAAAGSTGGGVNITAAAGSSTSTGGAGGNVAITAGNAGGSGANNGGNITLQGGSATSTGTAGGVIVKDASNNTSAFQVQNASSEPVFDVDTTNSNLITNPGFETGTTGWAATGSGSPSIAPNTTLADTYEDRASLLVTTASGTANTGATVTSFTTSLTPAAYTLTFYAMAQTTNFSTLNVTTTGGGAPTCLTSQTVVTTGFTRYTCSFTGTSTNITAINFIVSDTTQHIFWLDAVQLITGSTVTPFSLGSILLRGAIQNPAVFESTSNSTTAFQILNSSNNQIENISSVPVTNAKGTVTYDAFFQIQDSSGNNILQVDPGNDLVDIGAGSAATDSTADLLILDNQASGTSADPTEVDGSMYYNTALGAFRCGVGGSWQYCVNGPVSSAVTVPGAATTSEAIGTATHIWVAPIYVPGPMTVNDFYVDVTVGLTTAGDIGLYNSAGTKVLDGGSSSLVITTTGLHTVAPTQTGTARNIPAGQYYAAWTSNGATGSIASAALSVAGVYKYNGTLSSGGGLVLPASITLGSITSNADYGAIGLSN